MANNSLSKASSQPLFRQIVDDLKVSIAAGDLAEHAALPSERAVAERHGVSRMTARRALEAVVAEGLAYSKDRKGRFVSPKRLDYDVSSMENFISRAAAKGIEIEMELLQSAQIRADQNIAGILSIPFGTELFKNKRMFCRGGHATFLETETVVAQRCAEMLGNNFGQLDKQLQQHRYSPLGHTADITIRMRALTPNEADLLGVMPYQTGIEQEQLVRDKFGDAFCFCRQIWRGEMAQFSARAILK
jgi:GntR family transcriptional regulator